MTNKNDTPGEQTTEGRRQFSIRRVPDPVPGPKRCPRCEADWVGCPLCEAKQLIPNAVGLQYTTEQRFHHGRCHRHGDFWRRCEHLPDLQHIGDHSSALYTKERVRQIVARMIGLAVLTFWLGFAAAFAFAAIQRAITLAH